MFNFFDHDNGFTKSGLPSPTKQSMGLELAICTVNSYGIEGNGQSGGGGGVPSGTASLSDVQGAHGGSNPISLSEYYGSATGVPSSAAISVDDLRGTAAFPLTGLSMFIDPGNTSCYSGSGTTVNDLSNTQSSMTLINTTYNSNNGGYFDFSGSGSGLIIGQNPPNMDRVVKNYTYHMFIYLDSTSYYRTFIGHSANIGAHFLQLKSGGDLRLWTTDVSGGQFGTATGAKEGREAVGLMLGTATGATNYDASSMNLNSSTWYHICLNVQSVGSCDEGYAKFYRNNVLQNAIWLDPQSNPPANQHYALMCAPNSSGGVSSQSINGRMGVVMYYSRSQSDADMTDVYDAFKSRYGLT